MIRQSFRFAMRTLLTSLAFVAAGSHAIEAQEEAAPRADSSTQPSRAELKEKQHDVSLEARDIERVLMKLKKASELSKARIGEAAKTAESASTALNRGESDEARKDALQAREMFQEIARQLEALLVEETPLRVAEARNLANQLARAERQFAQQFKGALNVPLSGGMSKIDPESVVKPLSEGRSGTSQNSPNTRGEGGENVDLSKDNKQKNAGGTKPEAMKASNSVKKDSANSGASKSSDDSNKDADRDKPGAGTTTKSVETAEDGQGVVVDKKDAKATTPKEARAGGGEPPVDKKPQRRMNGEARAGMTDEERRDALARRAQQLAQMGKTLEDVLKSIAESTEPADRDAVAKVEAILKETDLIKAIESMQSAAAEIRADKFDDVRLASLDIADRMEIASQRLDAAYQRIVAPQAEELKTLEQALADLREKLTNLETQSQITRWHREAQDLLSKLDKMGISEKLREAFLEEMTNAGLSLGVNQSAFNWGVSNGIYEAPRPYGVLLVQIQEELQARIQNLLLADITSATDEATPPKYQDLVERYYQVLSRDTGVRTNRTNRISPQSVPVPKSRTADESK